MSIAMVTWAVTPTAAVPASSSWAASSRGRRSYGGAKLSIRGLVSTKSRFLRCKLQLASFGGVVEQRTLAGRAMASASDLAAVKPKNNSELLEVAREEALEVYEDLVLGRSFEDYRGKMSAEERVIEAADNKEACCSKTLSIHDVKSSAVNGGGHFSRSFFKLLELISERMGRMGDGFRNSIQKPQTEEEVQLLAALKGRMVCAAAPLLFAAVSQSVNTPLTVVASGMAKWLELYSGVLMVRVLLSWFPNIPWERQPLQAMRDMCDPYLNLFRNIIPPLFNALDLSPMLAFLVLGVLTSILNTTVQAT